jgi:hypothetical protein
MVCAEQIAKRFVSCKGRTDDFGLAKQKGRLRAARVSAGPRHEEKVIFVFRIFLRFADLAATYSPAS